MKETRTAGWPAGRRLPGERFHLSGQVDNYITKTGKRGPGDSGSGSRGRYNSEVFWGGLKCIQEDHILRYRKYRCCEICISSSRSGM